MVAGHPGTLQQPTCTKLGVTYKDTDDGCKVTGFSVQPNGIALLINPSVDLTAIEWLDVNDIIVEVGGVSAKGMPKNLEDLVNAAYDSKTGDMSIKVLDKNTQTVNTFTLP